MGLFSEITRPLWIRGLNDVGQKPTKPISAWICDEDFSISSPIATNGCTELIPFASNQLLTALANDCGRFAGSAFESFTGTFVHIAFKKSYAWLLIKNYYSAFYAAHALMRFYGRGVLYVQSEQAQAIDNVHQFTFSTPASLKSGQYSFEIVDGPLRLIIQPISASGGVHEQFWSSFKDFLSWLSAEILKQAGKTSDQQSITAKLDELRTILCLDGCNGGNWLSRIRNDINYKTGWSVWHPYAGQPKILNKLTAESKNWDYDTLKVDLTTGGKAKMIIFQSACQFLTAACLDVSRDMGTRCSNGQSFLRYSILDIVEKTKACSC